MGKPASPLPVAGGRSEDAISLHSQPDARLLDDDALELHDDDLPPLYEESNASSSLLLPPGPPASIPTVARTMNLGLIVEPHRTDAMTGTQFYLNKRLATDANLLEQHIKWWSTSPPRPSARLLGTHREQVDQAGKKERRKVVDFDVQIELTPYLYSDPTTYTAWKEIRTVDNGERVRRGTVLRKRSPGVTQSLELGGPDAPTVGEWCHRFCASHAGLKCFTFKRRMLGFDEERVESLLRALVHNTNYGGHLEITFPVKDDIVEVYNDCRTNQWRLTTWIVWLCMLTATFLFTWPYLFFRTKRWEVVTADWYFSRPSRNGLGQRDFVSMSEDQWYDMWARAIYKAVLEKRQGTLDQRDLIAATGNADPLFGNSAVDGAVAMIRAGVSAMSAVNRQLGWGYDA